MVDVSRWRLPGAPGVRRCPWRVHARRLLPRRRAIPVVVLGDRSPRAESWSRAPSPGPAPQVPRGPAQVGGQRLHRRRRRGAARAHRGARAISPGHRHSLTRAVWALRCRPTDWRRRNDALFQGRFPRRASRDRVRRGVGRSRFQGPGNRETLWWSRDGCKRARGGCDPSTYTRVVSTLCERNEVVFAAPIELEDEKHCRVTADVRHEMRTLWPHGVRLTGDETDVLLGLPKEYP